MSNGPTETLSGAIPTEIEEAACRVLRRAKDADLSLVTAESCTGGLLASLLTDVEGLSGRFERGYVVYSVPAKCELLGIAEAQVNACGAVSHEVAEAMAVGALRASKADIALAITGYAGKAQDGEEAGLVHFGCAREGRETAHREEHFGDVGRGPVRIAALRVALEMIEAMI